MVLLSSSVIIETEGAEKIQLTVTKIDLADTAHLGNYGNVKYATLKLFSDGSNWYDLDNRILIGL